MLSTSLSTFELGFQWAEVEAGEWGVTTSRDSGKPIRVVAKGLQRLTWVNIAANGHVTVEPFPVFFADFIAQRTPPAGMSPFVPPLGSGEWGVPTSRDMAKGAEEEVPWWRSLEMWGTHPHPSPPSVVSSGAMGNDKEIARLSLHTDDSHANFVGNIYFTHIATLVERICHNALRALATTGNGGVGCPHISRCGFYITNLHLVHLGEAMPGDVLEAKAYITEVGTKFCSLTVTVLNAGSGCGGPPHISNTKQGEVVIASARVRLRLFAMDSGEAVAISMPQLNWDLI